MSRSILLATFVAACLLLILGAGSPARAQFPPPRGTSVDQLIAHFGAADILVGETSADGKWLVVRHPPSALTCHFPAEGDQNLLVVQYPSRERGQDIVCSWIEGRTGIRIWASPAEGRTAAQGLAAELEEFRSPPSQLTPYEGPPRSVLPEGVVEGAIVNYGLVHRLAVFESKGWLILLDVAYYPSSASEAEQIDDRVLRGLVPDARAVR